MRLLVAASVYALPVYSGGDVTASVDEGGTPLHPAAGSGQLEATRVLLEHHADASAKRYAKKRVQ